MLSTCCPFCLHTMRRCVQTFGLVYISCTLLYFVFVTFSSISYVNQLAISFTRLLFLPMLPHISDYSQHSVPHYPNQSFEFSSPAHSLYKISWVLFRNSCNIKKLTCFAKYSIPSNISNVYNNPVHDNCTQ